MDTGNRKKTSIYPILRSLILLFIILLMSCTSNSSKEEKPTYKIGFMICNSRQDTLQRFEPFVAYLSKKLDVNFEMVAIDTADFTKNVDDLHFTHTNSLLYAIMHRNHGVEILAAEKNGSLGYKAQGLIISSKKSGLKTIEDLRDKTMIFGPMLGPTSFMAQVDLLIKGGIDPDEDLAFYSIPRGSFKHEKVIYGVLFNKFDAGAAPLLDFERMVEEGRINEDDFTIIAKSEHMPYCNFGATQKVDEAFAKKFKQVLLDIKDDDTVEFDGQVLNVLERAIVEGYEDVQDKDFDGIREMAKRTNMPPYQRY
jgi:phosphonate transport system substrate-binding protein